MLRALVNRMGTPLTRALQIEKHVFGTVGFQCPSAIHSTPVCCYGIRPKQVFYSDEETLTSKILGYIRCSYKKADDVWIPQYTNQSNSAHTIYQMLLVIAHSLKVNSSDIINTFSLYLTTDHSILKDIISKKTLMNDVGRRVKQNLSGMTLDELKRFAQIMKELDYKRSKYLIGLVSAIDSECERRALQPTTGYEQCMELFDILLSLHGNRVCQKNQFDVFMSLFETHIKSASPIELVHILHFIGLGKKGKLYKEFVLSIAKVLGEHIDKVSFVDAGIAATGIFKACVKLSIDSQFLLKIGEHLNDVFKRKSKLSDFESYSFIGMIKLLRSARYINEDFFNSVSTFVMEADEEFLSPEVIAHILALYTNISVYHPEVFTKLERVVLVHLCTPSALVRLKDLARVLWCFSHTRHSCSQRFLDIAEKSIIDYLENNKPARYPQFLAGSLLSMAILGHCPPRLITEAYQPQTTMALQNFQRSKPLSRLLMLHEVLKVEQPDLSVTPPAVSKQDMPTRTITDEIRYRPALATLMEGARVLNVELGLPVFKLTFPVPHFNYASLVISNDSMQELGSNNIDYASNSHISKQLSLLYRKHSESQVAIELLDSNTTLLNKDGPKLIGMIDMKVKIMKKNGWVIKQITEEEVSKCENDSQAVAAVILDALNKTSL